MRLTHCLVLLLVASHGLLVSSQWTGMRATLSMTAIDQLKNSMLPPMVAQIGTLTAADQQTSWGSFFFTVHANIQNIRANGVQVDVPSSTVSCANPQQMAVHLAGIALTVQFDWSITSSLGDQSGSGTATTSGSAADLLLSMSVAADGRPAVSLDAVVVTLNDFQVGVNGGGLLSQLQDWLAGLMTGTIKDSFRAAVEAALRDTVSQRINSLLAEVPTSLNVYSTFAVDLTLAAAPNCTAEFLDVRLDGEVFDTSAPTVRAAHGAAANLDISADDSLGAVLYVAEGTLNGAQWILWQAGLLHATVDSTMVPSSVPVKLNSDVLAAFLPGLASQFPHRDLQLDASARAAPTVLLAAGQPAAGFWPLDVKVSVLPERQMFLHFQADFNFDFAVETDGSTLRGTITSATVSNIVILQSTVGTVNVASAQTFANALLLLGQNIVNTQFLQKGLALPQFAGGNLLNATVALSAGFAAVTGVPVLNLN